VHWRTPCRGQRWPQAERPSFAHPAQVPVILPVFLPLAYLFILVRARYITASREVKRWEAITRSPVYADFSANLKVTLWLLDSDLARRTWNRTGEPNH
jgi:hypothetical protein